MYSLYNLYCAPSSPLLPPPRRIVDSPSSFPPSLPPPPTASSPGWKMENISVFPSPPPSPFCLPGGLLLCALPPRLRPPPLSPLHHLPFSFPTGRVRPALSQVHPLLRPDSPLYRRRAPGGGRGGAGPQRENLLSPARVGAGDAAPFNPLSLTTPNRPRTSFAMT